MAMAMREAAGKLIASWRRRGRLLGFAERSGYTAIGTVCNLAARLCAEAFFFQAEDGIRVGTVTGVQTCALPISTAGKLADLNRRYDEAVHAGSARAVERSEERRVGKECRSRRAPYHSKKNEPTALGRDFRRGAGPPSRAPPDAHRAG